MVFGSKAAPTLWGRAGAFLARSAQAIADGSCTRLELYVDDPVIVSAGPFAHRETWLILLWWMVLGVPIAWAKALHGYE
eukprot:4834600-Amphidinium_carterae.1